MAAVLLLLAMMASPTTATTAIPVTNNAMSTNSASGEGIVKAAQVRHNWIFGAYVLLLGLTVVVTYLVWSSGNKVQDAVQADATARIAEAQSTASQADARSKQLQKDNLALQAQVASLQTDASNAKAAQQSVEVELAAQKEKTANAEIARLQMQEALEPRRASSNGIQREELALFSGTKFFITFASDPDSQDLSANIVGLLRQGKWIAAGAQLHPVSPLTVQPLTMVGGRNLTIAASPDIDDGVVVMAKPASWDGLDRLRPMNQQAGDAASLLCYVLKDSHIECRTFAVYRYWPPGLPDDAVWVVIGRKPAAFFQWANDPEAQQNFIKMEKKNQTNSADDLRDRAALVARRRAFLNQDPK